MVRPKKEKDSHWGARKNLVKRNTGYFLSEAFEELGDNPVSIDEIRAQMEKNTGISVNRTTLKKFNKSYFEENEISPLCRIDDDHYVLNRYLFENTTFRKPRPRGYSLKPEN